MEILMEYLAKGFVVMLMVSLPCVLMAAGIGLVVGILQAVTQVQEQTIAAAPKILLVFLTVVILGAWYVRILTDYFREGANLAFEIVPKNETYVLPADYYKYSKPFIDEMQDGFKQKSNMEQLMKNPGKIPWSQNTEKADYTKSDRSANPAPNFIERNKIMGR